MGTASCSHVCLSTEKPKHVILQSNAASQNLWSRCSEAPAFSNNKVLLKPPQKDGAATSQERTKDATASEVLESTPFDIKWLGDEKYVPTRAASVSSSTSTAATLSSPKSLPEYQSEAVSEQPAILQAPIVPTLPLNGMASRRRPAPIITEGLTPKKKTQPVPGQLQASHILVKHTGSENQWSWRMGARVSLSHDEALENLKIIHKQLTKDNFNDFARKRSDCHSHKSGGDLGYFGIKAWAKLEKVVESLTVGQISEICETETGLHIVIRTA